MATPTNLPSSFTSGDVLTAANMNLLRGAFRILQVVEGSYSTVVSSTSSSYVDTGLTASITPQSTSSKVLVIVAQNCYSANATTGMGLQILRGATSLMGHTDLVYGTNSGLVSNQTLIYLDSPASTSALTYKTQFNRSSGGGTVYTQVNSNRSTIILMEVSA